MLSIYEIAAQAVAYKPRSYLRSITLREGLEESSHRPKW
jgi:hypothetical protein